MLGHPGMLLLSLVPFVLGLVGFAGGVVLFLQYGNSWITSMLMTWFSSWQDNWLWMTLYWVVKGLMFASVFMLCVLSSIVLMAAVASPVNEYISVKVERDLLGDESQQAVPWRHWPRVLVGEFSKAFLVILVPILLLFIPGVNLMAGMVAAFLIGWDFYDYPLARRGWGFPQRFGFVVREFWSVLGFGLWLAIPFVHVFLVPLAVAGGTILNLEALAKRGLVTLKVPSSAPDLWKSKK